jgi:ubiquinone/menaquinone biosynthesis C-methylase UbiE
MNARPTTSPPPTAHPSPAHPSPTHPQPNFDRIARIYRWAEYLTLGPLLLRTRNHFLPELVHRRHALILGDGDGRFTARLLASIPTLRALAVDTSAAMLHLLRQRCRNFTSSPKPGAARLRTLRASALTLSPEPTTDLIVTHFFLDCLTQPEVDALALRLAAPLQPGALWLLSDFALPPSPILRPLAALYLRALYFAFRILTGLRVTHLPDPQRALAAAGFERIARRQFLFGLLYTELWRRR